MEPYRFSSYYGAKYFLTIVYDHSRATWIFLLNNKKQVYEKIVQFIAYVETQFVTKIKGIITDNETEFVQARVKRVIAQKRDCT